MALGGLARPRSGLQPVIGFARHRDRLRSDRTLVRPRRPTSVTIKCKIYVGWVEPRARPTNHFGLVGLARGSTHPTYIFPKYPFYLSFRSKCSGEPARDPRRAGASKGADRSGRLRPGACRASGGGTLGGTRPWPARFCLAGLEDLGDVGDLAGFGELVGLEVERRAGSSRASSLRRPSRPRSSARARRRAMGSYSAVQPGLTWAGRILFGVGLWSWAMHHLIWRCRPDS